MKTCTACGKKKPLTEFWLSARGKNGVNPECKECARERSGEYREAHRDELNKKHRARYASDEKFRKRQQTAGTKSRCKKALKIFDERTEMLEELKQDPEFRDLLISMGK